MKIPINLRKQAESTAETVARIQKYDTGSFRLRDTVLKASDVDMKAAREAYGIKTNPKAIAADVGKWGKELSTNPKKLMKYGAIGIGADVGGELVLNLCGRRGQFTNAELYGMHQQHKKEVYKAIDYTRQIKRINRQYPVKGFPEVTHGGSDLYGVGMYHDCIDEVKLRKESLK